MRHAPRRGRARCPLAGGGGELRARGEGRRRSGAGRGGDDEGPTAARPRPWRPRGRRGASRTPVVGETRRLSMPMGNGRPLDRGVGLRGRVGDEVAGQLAVFAAPCVARAAPRGWRTGWPPTRVLDDPTAGLVGAEPVGEAEQLDHPDEHQDRPRCRPGGGPDMPMTPKPAAARWPRIEGNRCWPGSTRRSGCCQLVRPGMNDGGDRPAGVEGVGSVGGWAGRVAYPAGSVADETWSRSILEVVGDPDDRARSLLAKWW